MIAKAAAEAHHSTGAANQQHLGPSASDVAKHVQKEVAKKYFVGELKKAAVAHAIK